ncbi:hypothetical protein OH77DRAFT_1522189 [Trametes cingulata]|nr:hypothetical protein OH77DRAFT_1522189 [Trametes cingulata]
MAICGIGSYEEPIVVSDDEDEVHVENELSRWSQSPTSSTQRSPIISDRTKGATRAAFPPYPPVSSSQKRKRQEPDMTKGANVPHGSPANPAKRAKKKQKLRKDVVRTAQSATPAPSHVQPHEVLPEPTWARGSFRDNGYMAEVLEPALTYRSMPMAPPIDSPASPYWPTDVRRGSSSSLNTSYSPMPNNSPVESSWGLPLMDATYRPSPAFPSTSHSIASRHAASMPRAAGGAVALAASRSRHPERPAKPVSTTLDDSLRRLEALSASLLAASAPPPPPSLAAVSAKPAALSVPAESDKRRIGKVDDKNNASFFDLSAPTLLPSPSTDTPPRAPSSANSIVMAHIPKKFRTREFVTSWAKRFGTIARLEVDPKAGKALVEYPSAEQADAAFTSFKLRGEGKEHIRVYRYKASTPQAATSTTAPHRSDIEEGEIEEGEVVEVPAPAPPAPAAKTKKKKKKAKKTLPLEQRFTDPAAAPAPPPNAPQREPSLIISQVESTPAPSSSLSPQRRPLQDRFSDTLLVADGVWEEEMDLESEDDRRPESPPVLSPPLLATRIVDMPDDGDVEELVVDMDVDRSSPARVTAAPLPETSISPLVHSPVSPSSSKRQQRPSSLSVAERRPSPVVLALEAQRREDGKATSKAKSQVPAPPSASATSTASSDVSATPEPATPRDLSSGADVSVVIATGSDIVSAVPGEDTVAVPAASAKVAKPAEVSLEDLAVSFITESIQAVVATSSPPPRPKSPPATVLPTPTAPPPPTLTPTLSTPQLTAAAQLSARKKRLEEHLAASRKLLDQISAAKTKDEKALLMRLFKERQRIMDAELNGTGNATPPSTPGPRVASAATPNPPPKATSTSAPFRWPETAPVMIIEISDDEADEAC